MKLHITCHITIKKLENIGAELTFNITKFSGDMAKEYFNSKEYIYHGYNIYIMNRAHAQIAPLRNNKFNVFLAGIGHKNGKDVIKFEKMTEAIRFKNALVASLNQLIVDINNGEVHSI